MLKVPKLYKKAIEISISMYILKEANFMAVVYIWGRNRMHTSLYNYALITVFKISFKMCRLRGISTAYAIKILLETQKPRL